MPDWLLSVELGFGHSDADGSDDKDDRDLPGRVAVIIGQNGSGKSTLLARLARIAHASPRERDQLIELGRLTPDGVGFTGIVAVSFSAFDSFHVPGISSEDRLQIAKDIDRGTGRYVFGGLRDIAGELREELGRESAHSPATFLDRREKTLLKPLEQLAAEFSRTITLVRDSGREALMPEALQPLFNDASFGAVVRAGRDLEEIFGADSAASYLAWSTGHKIVLHVAASLAAYTERKSLVLFDEPEAHLHPPLLAALMHAIRIILVKRDAFAVVATHSPVIVQETMARHVRTVRREGSTFTVLPPPAQTFGENIGTITAQTLGLTSDITDYHRVLRAIATRHRTLDQIEAVFDGELSMQARAYVMALLAERGKQN